MENDSTVTHECDAERHAQSRRCRSGSWSVAWLLPWRPKTRRRGSERITKSRVSIGISGTSLLDLACNHEYERQSAWSPQPKWRRCLAKATAKHCSSTLPREATWSTAGGVITVLKDAIQEAKKASGAHGRTRSRSRFQFLSGCFSIRRLVKKGAVARAEALPFRLPEPGTRLCDTAKPDTQAVVPETIADLKRPSAMDFGGFSAASSSASKLPVLIFTRSMQQFDFRG